MKKVRWGVIGAGRIAHTFCQDIKLVENANLCAIASRSYDSALTFAAEHNIDKAYGDYQSLFNDDDIDAVYVATPHNFHFPQCRAALVAGKHVLCEKPFTVSPQECDALIELALKNKLFLMEAMWTYFLPAMKQAKHWYESGKIGDLVQIDADFGYPLQYAPDAREYNKALNGGCLLEMGIYPLAFSSYFTSESPLKIDCVARFAENGVEDDLAMLFQYPSFSARLATSFRARLPNWGFVIGTKGYIAIPDFFRASQCFLHVLDEQVDSFDDARSGNGFEYQIEQASHSILTSAIENPTMPHQQSLTLQLLMETIFKQITPST